MIMSLLQIITATHESNMPKIHNYVQDITTPDQIFSIFILYYPILIVGVLIVINSIREGFKGLRVLIFTFYLLINLIDIYCSYFFINFLVLLFNFIIFIRIGFLLSDFIKSLIDGLK